MKKKVLLAGVALLSVAALASCGNKDEKKPEDEKPKVEPVDLNGKNIKVYINYKAISGVSYVKDLGATYTNPIDGVTYTRGQILPMWSQVKQNLGCTITDAVKGLDDYTQDSEEKQYTYLTNAAADLKANVDVLLTKSTCAVDYATGNYLVNLNDYMDIMPNLKAFLDENQSIKKELTDLNGNMYMAPYFDGVNSIEKMFLFNTEVVEKLLDNDTAQYDTTAAKATQYTPFIDTSADYTVIISENGVAKDLTVKAAKNPIARQNDLTTKNGSTYVQALKDYIDEAYMPSKQYTKRSEVFTSEKACYSTDDMIALMRCVVNNSVLLTGEADKTIGIVPRGDRNNRIITILQMAQIWGVRGLTSEKDYLYYDNDGNLKDARTQQATYDALTKLNQLKQEGLIIDGFEKMNGKGNDTTYHGYLSGADGVSLMIYDYNATQAVQNKLDETTHIGNKDSNYNGIMPVLPPVTTWKDNNINDAKYKYTRYSEDARAFKSAGSVVINSGDEDRIKAACQLVDYFYGKEGSELQDYGPAAYRDGTVTLGGVQYPKFKNAVFEAINKSGKGWNDWMRDAMGTTQGMGHVRTDGLDYQVTHPTGQKGLANVANAVKSGALIIALTSRNPGFGATVPAYYANSPKTDEIKELVDFWAQGNGETQWRKVITSGWSGSPITEAKLKSYWENSDKIYLKYLNDQLKLKSSN